MEWTMAANVQSALSSQNENAAEKRLPAAVKTFSYDFKHQP